MKAKVYIGAKKYAVYIGRKIVEKTMNFFGFPARFFATKDGNLKDYKMYGKTVQSNLPEGYTQLESLSSTGYEYINTGLVIQSGDEIELDYEWLGNTPSDLSSDMMFFGCQNIDTARGGLWTELYRRESGLPTWYARFGGTGSNSSTASESHITGRHLLNINQQRLTIDDSRVIVLTAFAGTFQPTPLTLFGRLSATGTQLNSSKLKVYGFKVINNGVVRLNLIPCKNADNILGMYDTVTEQFLVNSGTGEFIAGEVIQPTPTNPVEIESVGVRTVNLFNINNPNVYNGYYATGTNTISDYPTNAFIYVPIEGGKTYAISGADRYSKTVQLRVCTIKTLPSSGTVVSQTISADLGTTGVITTDIDDRYLLVFICGDSDYNGYGSVQNAINANCARLQIQEGLVATEYEPYGYKIPVTINDTITNIYLSEPLRKFGDYVDYIDFDNQKVVRNVGVLEGEYWNNTSWKEWKKSASGINRYYYGNAINQELKAGQFFLCNVGFCDTPAYGNSVLGAMGNTVDTGLSIVMPLNINTVELVKQYMIDNAKLYYYFATPTEESITLPEITLQQGNITMDTDTKIKPSQLTITGDIDDVR